MPTDIGVHDLSSSTSHSPFVATATTANAGNDAFHAFDSAVGTPGFWIGTNAGVDKLTLNRGNANLGLDVSPHDLTSNTSHASIVIAASSFESGFGGFPAWKALDGTVSGGSAYWLGKTGLGVDWWSIDWGSGVTHIIKSYWIRVNDIPEPNRAPKNWTFEGSSDNISWTVLHTVTNQTSWDSGETRYFEPSVITTAYRYHRINITANNGDATYVQLCEVYLFDVVQDRTRSVICGSYTVQVKTTANRDPKNWTLQGNKFEGAGWVTIDTQTNQTAWSNNESRTFTCPGGGDAYQGFRINITANNGDASFTEIQELTLFQGNNSFSETLTMALSMGATPANAVAALESRTLAITAGITPANTLAALESRTLAISCGITPANTVVVTERVTIALQSGITVANTASIHDAVTMGLAGLGMIPIRFQAGVATIAMQMGMSVIDTLGNVTPDVFRPGPSGQAGIFRAVDAGDARPGVFKPATDIGTPGRFKPTG